MNDFSALNPSFYINEYRKLTGTKLELFKGKDKVYDVLSGKSKIDNTNISYLCGILGMTNDYWRGIQEKYDMNKYNNPDIEIDYALLSDMMHEILCLGKTRKLIDEEGYMEIYNLLEDINEQEVFNRNINYFDILSISQNSIHIIYQINKDKIRALYGHDKKLNIKTNVDIPEQYVYLTCNKDYIKDKKFISSNKNEFKYFSKIKNAYEAKEDDELVLFVDTKTALRNGIEFKKIGNNVWNSTKICEDAIMYEDFFKKGMNVLGDNPSYEEGIQNFYMGCRNNDVRCKIGTILCELKEKTYQQWKGSAELHKKIYNKVKYQNVASLIVRNEEYLYKEAEFQVHKYNEYLEKIKSLVEEVEELNMLGDEDSARLLTLINKLGI